MKQGILLVAVALVLFVAASCTHHTVETQSKVELAPVEVKPIHIVLDVNIKIQEALKKKFEKEDEIAKSITDADAEEALKKYLSKKGE